MESHSQQVFRTDTGLAFGGLTADSYGRMLQELQQDYQVSSLQICEAASFSMAMVARTALGLSAADAEVVFIAAPTLSGACALATARHLSCAGTNCRIIIAGAATAPELAWQVAPLKKMELTLWEWSGAEQNNAISELLTQAHAVIVGLTDPALAESPIEQMTAEILNEHQTPAHCLVAPVGIDHNSGQRLGTPLFASSTLALGAPLQGLHQAQEFCGRIYLCDISVPPALYRRYGANLCPVFAEQPVKQIFPIEV